MAYLETRRDLTHGGEQVTFKGLQKERPLQRELSRTTDHHGRRLRATGRLDALLQKIIRTDETTAAMGAQGAGADQNRITPGQGLFQNTPIAGSTQLGRSTRGRCKAPIKTDRQHEANGDGRSGQVPAQTGATASRDAGVISSCGVSA